MSIEQVVDVVYSTDYKNWNEVNKKALQSLFGSQQGRYHLDAAKTVQLRAPDVNFQKGIPFAAYINPGNPDSGPYGGFSFVIFPAENQPALVGLVVGTQGLAPDESILGRPGHARKAQAICAWLNTKYGKGRQVAWAKHDPTRTDIELPDLPEEWSPFRSTFQKYGHVIYAMYKPDQNRDATRDAIAAFLDLTFRERGYSANAANADDGKEISKQWHEHLMPRLTRDDVRRTLDEKRFVVIQGPPGTGKTTLAQELLEVEFGGRGKIIQLHPNTTYETVIGGLAPLRSEQGLGFQFAPKSGFLMEAAKAARDIQPKPYLLVIDEINRADLSKVLGEAIFLLEAHPARKREIELPYDFGEPFRTKFALPENLFVLGTMNSADRSIAIVDVAIRRRFAFVSLWPQIGVVKENACKLMLDQFQRSLDIFIEHAQEDAFNLVPGHSYFLESDEERAKANLKTGLVPLLEEYLAQGYVGGFSEQIRGYLQELRSL